MFDPGDSERITDRIRRRAGDDVGLVVVGAGDHHVGVLDAGLFEDGHVGAVAGHRQHVVGVGEFLGTVGPLVNDCHRVFARQIRRDALADLPAADDEDIHGVHPLIPTDTSGSGLSFPYSAAPQASPARRSQLLTGTTSLR